MSFIQRFGGRLAAILLTLCMVTGLGVLIDSTPLPQSVYSEAALSPEQSALRARLLEENARNYAITADLRQGHDPLILRRSDGRLVTGAEAGLSSDGVPRLTSKQQEAVHGSLLVTHPIRMTLQPQEDVRNFTLLGALAALLGMLLVCLFSQSTRRGGRTDFEDVVDCRILALFSSTPGLLAVVFGVTGGRHEILLISGMWVMGSVLSVLVAWLWCRGASERKLWKEFRRATQQMDSGRGVHR